MKKILFTLILCALAFSAGAQDFKPFILNDGAEYKTLQEAIDNAPSGSASTIKVKPCPPDIAEYGSAYSTNIVSNINAHGCEIFTHSKSLTIEGQAGGTLPILKDFVIVLESTAGTKPDYTFSNLAFSGKSIKSKRAQFARTRKELQQRQTPSARRRLKALGHRENGWMRDVNHRVSKALVGSNPQGTLFVLEDLTGIRGATERVRTKDRYVTVSWSYYDLEQKLVYKASLAGQKVVRVSPEYTSQRCPVCGAIDKHSRDKSNHVYKCSHCGYQSDDDRIGAMNLYQLGLEYLKGTEHPRIQSPSGKPGDGGCRQSPCDATPRRKAKRGRSYGKERNACTTGQSQAHQSSVDG